ncbi:MAG: helix-turn-helix domain-containing protein [Candidatus Odinarchaeota archaeon]
MDIDYSEEQFKLDFSIDDLKVLIDHHLQSKEAAWLDFKDAPVISAKEGRKIRADLPLDIQSFTHSGGGVIILGIDQRDPNKPIKGVKDVDNWCNFISKLSGNLNLPLLFPVVQIDGQKLIFIVVPQPREPIFYEGKIRIRSGTVRRDISSLKEQEDLKKRLSSQPSGYHTISIMRNAIRTYRIIKLRDGEESKSSYLLYRTANLNKENINLSLLVFMFAKLEERTREIWKKRTFLVG